MQERLSSILSMWAERKVFRRATIELLRQAMLGEISLEEAVPRPEQPPQQPMAQVGSWHCPCTA